MNRMIAWFAENHVAANLLMFAILAAGLLSAPNIKQSIFPDFDTKFISATIVYPGSSPEDIERAVTIRIEEEIQDIEGIEEIRSSANEGATNVTIEMQDTADTSKALSEIENRIDAITTLPEETEEPIVREILFAPNVLDIVIHGDADERSLKLIGQRIRDDLAALPGISQVELSAVRPYEISIEVSESALQQYGLRFDEVVMAVRRGSIDLPGGSIKTDAGEILLRTDGQAYHGFEFERIPLLTRDDGSRLAIGDVARVIDGFEESDRYARFDGEPAVFVLLRRVGDQQALEVARQGKAYLVEARTWLPEGVEVTVWDDSSQHLEQRIDMMLRNAAMGFGLVLVLLAIFLKLRVAFWVAMGLPVAVAGGLALMGPLGLSINVLTVFAFIMALGILVDDAIVTGENIYTHQERDPTRPLETAISGAQEVATPVIFGVLTTVAAFAPFGLIRGQAKFMTAAIGGVMVASLLFSLVESKLVLPSHLAHWSGDGRPSTRRIPILWARFQRKVSERLRYFVAEIYGPAVERCVEYRYTTAAVSFAVLIVVLSLVESGWVKSVMMPSVQSDTVMARLTMPLGTPAAETADAIARIEAAAYELQTQLEANKLADEPSPVEHVLSMVGTQTRDSGAPRDRPGSSGRSHVGQVTLGLSPSEQRSMDSRAIEDTWRELVGPIAGAEELTFSGMFRQFGDPVEIELRGDDIEALEAAAAQLSAALERYPGIYDIRDSYRTGKRELEFDILPSAEALGLTLEDIGRQVRQAFYGAEVQRIQRGRDEVKVMVRYPASERRSLVDVQNMRIRLPDGTAVPFRSIAIAEPGRGPASISRHERKRRISVTANLDEEVANAQEIVADLEASVLPGILADHAGVSFGFGGEQQERREAFAGLRTAAIVALLSIFCLLAIPLRSYLQPFVIMLTVPFGYVGAVIGHLIMGYDMSFLSLVGVLACAGVVVNDSLVLVIFVNRLHDQGLSLREAVVKAGQARFRAIMLTSVTTFAGLVPIMGETSTQAQFVVPMAVSLAFGVVIATFFTLLLIPAVLLIADDLKQAASRGLRTLTSGLGSAGLERRVP